MKSLIKTLGLTNQEVLMRARADLRLGIPIVLAGKENDVILADFSPSQEVETYG